MRSSKRKTAVNVQRTTLKRWSGAEKQIRNLLVGCVVLTGFLFSMFANAQEQEIYKINLPAQSVAESLIELSEQIDVLLLFPSEIAKELKANPVHGRYTLPQALEIMLKGTGYSGGLSKKGVLMISLEKSEAADESKTGGNAMNKRAERNIFAGVAAAVLSVFTGQGAIGQEGQEDKTREVSAPQIEEVVVTAQKRGEQSLLETPISVGVLEGSSLEDPGITELASALNSIGGLNLVKYQAGQSTISVRGVGSENLFAGGTPIGYYLDEAAFGFIQSANLPDTGAYDLERVEVLRGPQGTLYGVSSLNGVVRVITKDANLDEFEFKTRADYSDTKDGGDNYGGDFAVSVPLVPGKLAVRGVVSYHSTGGWIDSPAATNVIDGIGADDVNDGNSATYRLKINAAPIEGLALEFGMWLSRVNFDAAHRASDDGNTVLGAIELTEQDLDLYSLELVYDFGPFSVLSATSCSEYVTDGQQNIILPVVPGGFPLVVFPNFNSAEAVSEEIRLTSNPDDNWHWSAGAFYRHLEDDLIQGAPAFFTSLLRQVLGNDEWAVFAEVSRRFWDEKLEATAGLRYYEVDSTFEEKSALVPRGFLLDEKTSFDSLSPRFVLTYYPHDDLALYASVSKGFRFGVIQDPNSRAADPTIGEVAEPDTLWNYEVGAKGNALRGRVAYEAALYYVDWTDVQQRSISPVGTTYLRNAGDASGLGVDVTLTTYPLEGLSVAFGFGWNSLELDQAIFAGPGVVLFNEGDRVNGSPEYTLGIVADYEFPLRFRDFKGRLSGSLNYNSRTTRHEFIDSAIGVVETESDEILNSSVSFSVDAGQHWGASIFVRNLFDEDDAASDPIFLFALQAPRLQPRTIGLQLSYQY